MIITYQKAFLNCTFHFLYCPYLCFFRILDKKSPQF